MGQVSIEHLAVTAFDAQVVFELIGQGLDGYFGLVPVGQWSVLGR